LFGFVFMLQWMRRFSKSWVSSLFLGALAVSFAAWGIGDFLTANIDTSVARVGSTSLPAENFQRDYRNTTRNIPVGLAPEQSRLMGKQVLDRMILGTALDNLTKKLGITASDARVRQEIQAVQAFAGPLGTFDHDNFLRLLQQAGYTEQEF